MMDVAHYPTPYVESCRDEFSAQATAYRDLIAAAWKASGVSLGRLEAALAAFEPGYFNNLLVALDARFVHRARAAEGDDGNPLNEVRLLCAALMQHGGTMAPDPSIRYDAFESVLGIDFGDSIALNADDFDAMSTAFLDAIGQAYPPPT